MQACSLTHLTHTLSRPPTPKYIDTDLKPSRTIYYFFCRSCREECCRGDSGGKPPNIPTTTATDPRPYHQRQAPECEENNFDKVGGPGPCHASYAQTNGIGSRPFSCTSCSSSMALPLCLPFQHALMAALKVMALTLGLSAAFRVAASLNKL